MRGHTSFFLVTRFQLMANRQNQHNIIGGNPTVFRDVAEPATRQYQFMATVLGLAAQQRMIRE